MSKRNTVRASILSVLVLSTVCMLSAVITAQKSPARATVTEGKKGLNAVNVKLARYDSAQPKAGSTFSAKTDENGNFTFFDVPAGEYIMTVSLPEGAKNTAKIRGGYNNPGIPARFCYITLNLPRGKKVEKGYDLKENKAFDPAIDPTTSKTITLQDFIVVFDGPTEATGTITIRNPNG